MRIRPHGLVIAFELQPGQLALDVEIADLAEIEEALVEFGPQLHPPAMDIVGQMVDRGEADARGAGSPTSGMKVDIVDRPLAIAVDEVDQAAADPLDGRDIELHRPDLAVHRLGAEPDRALVGLGGVGDAKRHRADRRAMQPGKGLGKAFRLGIEDEIDLALFVEGDVLRAVSRRRGKPHALEQRRQCLRVGPGIFDELEPVRTHWVVPQITPLPLRGHHDLRSRPDLRQMWSTLLKGPRPGHRNAG